MNDLSIEKIYKDNEHNWKELLYTLFYEIKSEILGCKIELDEEEYQENVRTITIPELIKYIHDSIQILILRKIEDSKQRQKEEDEKFYLWKYKDKKNIELSIDQRKLYENIIQNLENKERRLITELFQCKLMIDALENKMAEYVEIENEFEEMKAKFKYEDGRFLKNDRKDNEIIIIRRENTNLKKIINKLEEQIKKNNEIQLSKDRLINNLKEEVRILEKKNNEIELKNNMCNNNNTKDQINYLKGINIHINNGTNNKNNIKNKYNKHSSNNSTKHSYRNNNHVNDESNISTKEKMNITDRIKKINSSIKNLQFSKYKKNQKKEKNDKKNDLLSTTRNESFERVKDDFLKKYFSGNASIKGSSKNVKNKSRIKISHFPKNNSKINLVNSSAFIPLVNSRRNLNNLFSMKKIFGIGSINSSRSTSKKKRFSQNNGINYKSIS